MSRDWVQEQADKDHQRSQESTRKVTEMREQLRAEAQDDTRKR